MNQEAPLYYNEKFGIKPLTQKGKSVRLMILFCYYNKPKEYGDMSVLGPSDDSRINAALIRMARTGRASNHDIDILVKHIHSLRVGQSHSIKDTRTVEVENES